MEMCERIDDYLVLTNLGYSEDKIRDFFKSLPPVLHEILTNATNLENVYKNVQYLLDDFDRDLLLRFVVFYHNSFVMDHRIFARHIDKAKAASEDWAEIIKKQYYGHDGTGTIIPFDFADFAHYEPYLDVISSYDEDAIQCSLDTSFHHPEERVYEFIALLNEKFGFTLTTANFDENVLYDLECGKYEVANSLEYLLSVGLTKESLLCIMGENPYLLMYGQFEIEECFSCEFGENYVEVINHLIGSEDEDELRERLWNM